MKAQSESTWVATDHAAVSYFSFRFHAAISISKNYACDIVLLIRTCITQSYMYCLKLLKKLLANDARVNIT